jgi:hypothetical protein
MLHKEKRIRSQVMVNIFLRSNTHMGNNKILLRLIKYTINTTEDWGGGGKKENNTTATAAAN